VTAEASSLLVSFRMQDFMRDWRRWTLSERVAAIIIALGLLGLPSTLAI
jgi:hypothetical protein